MESTEIEHHQDGDVDGVDCSDNITLDDHDHGFCRVATKLSWPMNWKLMVADHVLVDMNDRQALNEFRHEALIWNLPIFHV